MYKKYLKISLILLFFITTLCGCSHKTSMNFNNENYALQFSKKSPLTKGYVNEYIKPNENIDNWTEMVGVYTYPNNSSPMGFAKELAMLVKSSNKDAGVSVIGNDKKNIAVIDFFTWVPTKGTGKIDFLEFNVFKFEKYKKGGLVGLQYARRYRTKDISSTQDFQKELKENRIKFVKMIMEKPIPEIVNQDI